MPCCWCEEGELVRFATECDGERVDGRCGCRRSMTGMSTLKATTTVRCEAPADHPGAVLVHAQKQLREVRVPDRR